MVRRATIGDVGGIARVLVDGWKSAYEGLLPDAFLSSFAYATHEAATAAFISNLPPGTTVFVEVDRDTVMGVAVIARAETGPDGYTAKLDALYVAPNHQRKGIGRRLFRTAVDHAHAEGHDGVFLWVFRDNPYRSFYELVGGRLLDAEQVDDFAGKSITSVAYGWRRT